MDRTADVHLSLPADLLMSLDQAARQRGMRRVSLLRQVIEDYLKQIEA